MNSCVEFALAKTHFTNCIELVYLAPPHPLVIVALVAVVVAVVYLYLEFSLVFSLVYSNKKKLAHAELKFFCVDNRQLFLAIFGYFGCNCIHLVFYYNFVMCSLN